MGNCNDCSKREEIKQCKENYQQYYCQDEKQWYCTDNCEIAEFNKHAGSNMMLFDIDKDGQLIPTVTVTSRQPTRAGSPHSQMISERDIMVLKL